MFNKVVIFTAIVASLHASLVDVTLSVTGCL